MLRAATANPEVAVATRRVAATLARTLSFDSEDPGGENRVDRCSEDRYEEERVNVNVVTRRMGAALAAVLVVVVASACGSSSSTSSSSTSVKVSAPTSGVGYTSPTAPSGTKVSGGTVYFTEGSDAPPNYIFPLYDFANCSTTNIDQLDNMLYPPLYAYGNNYRPTVDYNDSIGQKPIFTNGGKTVTIHLNAWKWSDGEAVTSRDLVFWMNLLKVNPSVNWCGFVPGLFPDNVTSYSAPNPTTFVLNFTKAYNPDWLVLNELSQLTPMPLAWDRTSLSQPAPTSDNGHLPDASGSAAAVYKFLDSQSKDLGSWATSPLWKVVDGPFRLTNFNTDGRAAFAPNPDYSGTPKPSISQFIELPFTSETAIYNQVRSGGPNAITVGNLPSQYAPQINTLVAEGYVYNRAASYSFNYFPLNLNSGAPTSPGGEPVRYIFRQKYFREAFQHLIDQDGWISAFLAHTADPTCGPIPFAPPSPLVSTSSISFTPCAYSPTMTSQMLTANGWKVVPGGATTCAKPGTSAGDCGAGIKAGEGISFNLDYQSGVVAVEDEMNDLAAQAKKVGITLNLTTHPFPTVVGAATPCAPTAATCKWTAENWGAGWIYGPDYLPTGEDLYQPAAAANAGSYVDPTGKMSTVIGTTLTAAESNESSVLATYANYVSQQDPVEFQPTSIGTFQGDAGTLVAKNLGGYAANALGFLTPQYWYFTK
jgi:peptide/nickel transport system substrate-binding protein